MSIEDGPRLFADDEAIRHVGRGLLDRSLPKEQWTHEAHLAACLWIVTERPEIDPGREMRAIISGYNLAVGGVNDDHGGYHDSITHCFIAGVRNWLARCRATSLVDRVNGLLLAPEGRRDWPLDFYSRERLFSVEARRTRIEPDLKPFPRADTEY
ncbi:hypothetical protein [Rhizorhabdus dicambivorans]|uniref:Uncharacterized protein n=1 Tax=Rhizorhabdus dicambivorans TaxID=1850238 RepID=A0A2A4FVY5_9SPHN|nr:hypothetical protein [Rhizorhabdus dicambivorans]ATE65335.1 hypothetical protein CMV14_13735 [Rhizorhabdus dicambivorans]PCE42336.1 hypothetical protein COO09_10045 [Rhizorhabdus dicambivorans]